VEARPGAGRRSCCRSGTPRPRRRRSWGRVTAPRARRTWPRSKCSGSDRPCQLRRRW